MNYLSFCDAFEKAGDDYCPLKTRCERYIAWRADMPESKEPRAYVAPKYDHDSGECPLYVKVNML